MGISIQAYRSTIGSFYLNCIRDYSFEKYPASLFKNGNTLYHLREWSKLLKNKQQNQMSTRFKTSLSCYIASSLLIHMLIALCNDVHPNPGPSSQFSDLSICHANVRSIKRQNRMTFINSELCGKFDIITCSETWLSIDDNSDKFKLTGYQMPQRKDRSIGAEAYGGVMAWVSDNIGCKRRKDLEPDDIEAMWLEITTFNKKLFLCVVYRTDSNTDNTYWDRLQDTLENVRSLYNPNLLICGDLNADFNTRQGRHLKNFITTNNFTFYNTEPTRITTTTATVLDQFIANFPIFERDFSILPPLPNCDHCVIGAKLTFKYQKVKSYKRTMWKFKGTDFEPYRDKLKQ